MPFVQYNEHDIEYQIHYGEVWIHANDLAHAMGQRRLQRLDKKTNLLPAFLSPTSRGPGAHFIQASVARRIALGELQAWPGQERDRKLYEILGRMSGLPDLLE